MARSPTAAATDGNESHAPTGPVSRVPQAIMIVFVIFLIAFAVRVANLGGKSMWVDEGASAIIASHEIETILSGELDQHHPPGYYALLHYVARVDNSEFALRLPSALASAATVVLIYLITAGVWSRHIALLAASIAALSPLDVWYAQEARQPAFAALTISLGYYGLSRRTLPGRLLALVGLTLGVYLDYITAMGWLAVGSVWIVFFWSRDRGRIRDWWVVTALGSMIIAPTMGSGMLDGLESLLGVDGPGIWYDRVLGSNPVTSHALGILALALAVGLIGSLAYRALLNSGRWGRLIVLTSVGLYLAVVALTPIPRFFSVKKIAVVGWPVVMVAVAVLIGERISSNRRYQMSIALLAVSLLAVIATLLVPKDDWRTAVAVINESARAGDVAWVSPDSWAADAYKYYHGILPVHHFPDPSSNLPAGGDVWLITKRRPQDPIPAIAAEEWFADRWALVEEHQLYRLAVQRYTSP